MSFYHLSLSFLMFLPVFLFATSKEFQNQDITSHMEKDFFEFKKNLEHYFAYLDMSAEKYKDNAYGRYLIQNKEEIKKQMQEANEIFLHLRQKFQEIGLARYRSSKDATLNANWMEAEITAWYISNIVSRFFPEGWETFFQSPLNEKELYEAMRPVKIVDAKQILKDPP